MISERGNQTACLLNPLTKLEVASIPAVAHVEKNHDKGHPNVHHCKALAVHRRSRKTEGAHHGGATDAETVDHTDERKGGANEHPCRGALEAPIDHMNHSLDDEAPGLGDGRYGLVKRGNGQDYYRDCSSKTSGASRKLATTEMLTSNAPTLG